MTLFIKGFMVLVIVLTAEYAILSAFRISGHWPINGWAACGLTVAVVVLGGYLGTRLVNRLPLEESSAER